MLRTARSLAVLAVVLVTALTGTASAAPVVNGIYDVPDSPKKLAQGSDGNIWVIIGGNALARFTPDGTKTDVPLTGVTGAKGITTGPDGNLWVTASTKLVRIPPANPAGQAAFTVNDIITPQAIVTGPDGNLWTASNDKVLRISTADPANPTLFTLTGALSPSARGITSAGGLLWAVDFGNGAIVSLTTAGVQTAYSVGGLPQEVAGSPSGQVLYANPGTTPHTVGRIVAGGLPQTTPLPLTDPFGITFGPDGAYWVAQFASGTLARVTTDGVVTTIGGLPTNSPREITSGPNNTLWVSLELSNKVARVTGVDPPPVVVPPVVVPPGGVPPGGAGTPVPPADTTAPVVSRLRVSPSIVRRPRPRTPVATFTLSEAAKVTVTVERLVAGRRSGGRCRTVRPPRAGVRCVKPATVGTVTRDAPSGAARLSIAVRKRGRALAAGSYRVSVVAVDAAGNRSTLVRAPLTMRAR